MNCAICLQASGAFDVCQRCAAAYVSWQRTNDNTRTTWASLAWAAERTRKELLKTHVRKDGKDKK
jgi:hypothetical protein